MNKKFDLQKETAKLYGYDQKFANASGPSAANIVKDILNMERNLDSGTRGCLERALKHISDGNTFGARSELDTAAIAGAIADNSQSALLLKSAIRMLSEAPPSPGAPPFNLQKETAALWNYPEVE